MDWTEVDGIELLEATLPGARVAFSCRLGGISQGDFAGLNLGIQTGDDSGHVVENRRRLASAIGREPDQILCARQVHGAELIIHDQAQAPSLFAEPTAFGDGPDQIAPPQGDAHATALPDQAALVFVADCLPIALSGDHGVAMVHGGWRGLAAGIIGRSVAAVAARGAAIGPGIGPCCFEVGDEVRDRFAALGEDLIEGRMLDLPGVAARLLERAGIETRSIERTDHCTRCEPERFFSHRGQGPDTGRQAGLVWVDG